MWNTCAASPKDTSTARNSAKRRALLCAVLWTGQSSIGRGLHEEVQQCGLLPAPGTSMYPPAPSPVSSCSAANEGQHRPHGRIDRVAAFLATPSRRPPP